MNHVERPAFSEGQLLSAVDLQLAVDYPRGELEAHTSVAHTSGVVDGMTFDFAAPVAPGTTTPVYVTPGLAVDDLGRQILIGSAMIVVVDPLAAEPPGSFPAYVWYTEEPVAPLTAVMNPCAATNSSVIRESANVGVFLSATAARAQLPHAVCLGYLGWTGTSFAPYTGKDPDVRQGGGIRAHEIVAPEHAVLAHSEDKAATTFSVKGTLQAIAADDLTSPALVVCGGAVVLSPSSIPLAQQPTPSPSVSLSYFAPSSTGNGLEINLGNNDPTSEVTINSQAGTVLVSIGSQAQSAQQCTGMIAAASADLGSVNASTNVVVTTNNSTLTMGAAQPNNVAGITASDTLTLAFGSGTGDEVMFVGGGAPVATIDANAMTANNVQIGVLDASSGASGLGITSGGDLEIRTKAGDLLFNPRSQGSPPFRLTKTNRLMNQTASPPADVTPLTSIQQDGGVLQLGALAIAFGTDSVTVNPLAAQAPSPIQFPVKFGTAPAFFVAVSGANLQTIFAVATSVSATSATYRVSRMRPDAPKTGDAAVWSSAAVDVTVSWVALGQLS